MDIIINNESIKIPENTLLIFSNLIDGFFPTSVTNRRYLLGICGVLDYLDKPITRESIISYCCIKFNISVDVVMCLISNDIILDEDHIRFSIKYYNSIGEYPSSLHDLVMFCFNQSIMMVDAKIKKNISNDECCICFTNVDEIYDISCKHIFHMECIDKWIQTNLDATCPSCRGQIPKKAVNVFNSPCNF